MLKPKIIVHFEGDEPEGYLEPFKLDYAGQVDIDQVVHMEDVRRDRKEINPMTVEYIKRITKHKFRITKVEYHQQWNKDYVETDVWLREFTEACDVYGHNYIKKCALCDKTG